MIYPEEEQIWKCKQHPSKRRRSGVCPTCLKHRLAALCPDCAHPRPCPCGSSSTTTTTTSTCSSASSSATISTLIDTEPSFCRSKSTAFPFVRSITHRKPPPPPDVTHKKHSIWSIFRWSKSNNKKELLVEVRDDDIEKVKMQRSKSVAVTSTSVKHNKSDVLFSTSVKEKGKGWNFPSPMKAFRHSKALKVFHQHSPLHRG